MSEAKLFVGGLAWSTDEHKLKSRFSEFGNISEAIVIKDRDTGRSRGFGFITFGSNDEAQSAIDAMNDTELDGRQIRVSMAGEKPEGGRGGGGGGGGRYGGGGGGYGGGGGGYGGGGGGYGGGRGGGGRRDY